MSWSLSTQIEIAAGPEAVREKLLDFASIPSYSPNGFVKAITPLSPTGTLNVGDKVAVDIARGRFESTIVENTPEELCWVGGVPYVFTIEHRFRYVGTGQGTTMFFQEEDFSGLFGRVVGWIQGEGFRREYEGFNGDLKRVVESEVSKQNV